MKKLFISQPMRGRTDEEILAARADAIQVAKDALGEDVEVLDSFFQDLSGASPLQHLGRAIALMAEADVVYFAPGWQTARGCCVEHECARQYGILRIDS